MSLLYYFRPSFGGRFQLFGRSLSNFTSFYLFTSIDCIKSSQSQRPQTMASYGVKVLQTADFWAPFCITLCFLCFILTYRHFSFYISYLVSPGEIKSSVILGSNLIVICILLRFDRPVWQPKISKSNWFLIGRFGTQTQRFFVKATVFDHESLPMHCGLSFLSINLIRFSNFCIAVFRSW